MSASSANTILLHPSSPVHPGFPRFPPPTPHLPSRRQGQTRKPDRRWGVLGPPAGVHRGTAGGVRFRAPAPFPHPHGSGLLRVPPPTGGRPARSLAASSPD